uniref:Uncharacterized protein TCIL3000_10_8440 n=1 Tax=Trypanosoma congolense (strain IL3000) TaxID=1068625 RepID=G0UXF1_TRYCI|nr:unnamed protein product [Trypanosoma congolense IL3000]
MTSRAWEDKADAAAEKDLPEFVRQCHKLPTWAKASAATDGGLTGDAASASVLTEGSRSGYKRFRDRDLDALLARTEPLLTSKHDRRQTAVPPVLSVLQLPRDFARSIHWHRNGQLAIVGGSFNVYLFHAAGRFVENISKIHVGKHVKQTSLCANGEDLFIVSKEAYTPKLLHLATEKVSYLNFLCTRELAPHRVGRHDNGKHELHITKAVTPNVASGMNLVGMANGSTITIASLSSGSVTHRIDVNDPVVDLAFTNSTEEITVATRDKLVVYDLRKSAQFLRELRDKGMVGITTFASSSSMVAVGSTSGIVSLYAGGNTSAPIKTLKNLTTSIDHVTFGQRGNGDSVFAFSSGGQKGAFRLASLPDCRVVPSFPSVGQSCDFVQCLTAAPTVPILSVGGKHKVTNYAL